MGEFQKPLNLEGHWIANQLKKTYTIYYESCFVSRSWTTCGTPDICGGMDDAGKYQMIGSAKSHWSHLDRKKRFPPLPVCHCSLQQIETAILYAANGMERCLHKIVRCQFPCICVNYRCVPLTNQKIWNLPVTEKQQITN